MNRLWVRLSLVIVLVAVLITVTPPLLRELGVRPPDGPPFPAEQLPDDVLSQIPPERLRRFEESVSERIWRNLSLNLVLAGALGLGIGILLSRGLVRPLTEIEKGARAIAGQDLTYRVPIAGSVELRAVGQAFNEMAAELERSQLLRRNLLADVTHELRHPVQVLRGNLQGILDGVFPLTVEEIAALSDQTLLLSRLVTDLHDLALAEAHELPLHTQTLDLRHLVRDSVDAVHPLAVEKAIDLAVELPAAPVSVSVDSGRMRQAIQNLLSNAISYTPEGGRIQASLRVRLQPAAATAILAIADSGRGIPAADLPRLFDRFYRAEPSRDRNLSGAGLGLAIVKAIVEAHGGSVAVDSAGPDLGSTFTIRLPFDGGGTPPPDDAPPSRLRRNACIWPGPCVRA